MPSEDIWRQLKIGKFRSEDAGNEDSEQEQDLGKEDYHGGIQASFPVTPHVLQKAWADTIEDLGYNTLKDPIDGDVLGGSTTANAIDSARGERSHAGVAFLEPSTKRENLFIRSGVLVEKIQFDDNEQDGKLVATTVRYSQGHEDVTVHVRTMSSEMLTTFYFKAEFNLRPTSLPLILSSKTDLLNLYTDDVRLPLHRLP